MASTFRTKLVTIFAKPFVDLFLKFKGTILYEAFPVCKETKKPLMLPYYHDIDNFNCTIELTDPIYHLLQLYIHQDAPMSCRIPQGKNGNQFVPFIINIGGKIEQSHIDVDARLNLIFTYFDAAEDQLSAQTGNGKVRGFIKAATSYNVNSNTTRMIIGEELTFQFSIRWFPSQLPHLSAMYMRLMTLVYCLLTAIFTFLASTIYYLGVIFPKRNKSHFSKNIGSEMGLFGTVLKRE